MSRENEVKRLRRNIPEIMKSQKNWCVFNTRWNEKKGKIEKFIIDVNTGKWANSMDSSTWTTFERAIAYMQHHGNPGIAYALNNNGIACIDLDHAIDDNKRFNSIAREILPHFPDTYTEKSVSEKGVHIFVLADLLDGDKYKNRTLTPDGEEIEIYQQGRFISMTGDTLNGIKELKKPTEETLAWLRSKLSTREKLLEPTNRVRRKANKSAREIIEKIEKSKKATDFRALYNGESLTGDHSRDDMKLLNILAYFTNADSALMREIFMSSALYRTEKGDKYLDISIKKAVAFAYTHNVEKRRETSRKFSTKKKQDRSDENENN